MVALLAHSPYTFRMSLARKLALHTGYQAAGKAVSTALGIAIIAIMTRHLGAHGFGIYSTANAFLQSFGLLLDLGLNVTLIALLGEHDGDSVFEKRCISALFTFRIIMASIVLLVLAPSVAWFMPYDLTTRLSIILLTGSFFFPSLNQVVTGVQQKRFLMHVNALGEVFGRLVHLGGLIAATIYGWGLFPIIACISLGSFANFAFSFWQTRSTGGFSWNFDPEFWKTALLRSWPIGLSIVFNIVYFKADTLILSFVRSSTEVGIYSAAYRVLEIMVTFPFMYAGLLLPILSQAWITKNMDRFRRLLGHSMELMLMAGFPLIAGAFAVGVPLMRLIAGDEFTASGHLLKLLIIAVAIIYINVISSHAIVAIQAQRRMLPVYAVVALGTLALYLIFIPLYGAWAAAWLTIASEVAITTASTYIVFRTTPFSLRPWTVCASALAAISMGVCTRVFEAYHLRLPANLLVSSVIYVALLIAFRAVSRQDFIQLRHQSK